MKLPADMRISSRGTSVGHRRIVGTHCDEALRVDPDSVALSTVDDRSAQARLDTAERAHRNVAEPPSRPGSPR